MDRKEGIRLHWLLKIYYFSQDKKNNNWGFSMSDIEKNIGYEYPQPAVRELLKKLINNNILIKCVTVSTHTRYKIDKKHLAKFIINNQLICELKQFLKDETILLGI